MQRFFIDGAPVRGLAVFQRLIARRTTWSGTVRFRKWDTNEALVAMSLGMQDHFYYTKTVTFMQERCSDDDGPANVCVSLYSTDIISLCIKIVAHPSVAYRAAHEFARVFKWHKGYSLYVHGGGGVVSMHDALCAPGATRALISEGIFTGTEATVPNGTLKMVTIGYDSALTSDGWAALETVFGACPIEEVKVVEANLRRHGVDYLSRALSASTTLKYVELCRMRLSGVAVATVLAATEHLVDFRISFSEIKFTDADAHIIAAALRSRSARLEKLTIYNSEITDFGIAEILDALYDNCCVEDLHVDAKGDVLTLAAVARLAMANSDINIISYENKYAGSVGHMAVLAPAALLSTRMYMWPCSYPTGPAAFYVKFVLSSSRWYVKSYLCSVGCDESPHINICGDEQRCWEPKARRATVHCGGISTAAAEKWLRSLPRCTDSLALGRMDLSQGLSPALLQLPLRRLALLSCCLVDGPPAAARQGNKERKKY